MIQFLHVVDGFSAPGRQVRKSHPEGFTAGRMSVAYPGNVLTAGTVLHGQSSLVNHLPGPSSHDVRPQQSVRLLVGQDLDEPVRVVVALRSAVGCEGELSDSVLHTFRLQIFFVFPYPCDLWVSVNDRGNTVVVDVDRSTADTLGTDDGLVLRLVCQHWSVYAVSDG